MLPKANTHGGAVLGLASLSMAAAIQRQATLESTPELYSIAVPASAPNTIFPPIDPDFTGLAFEQNSFVRYSEDDDGNSNEFSQNLIANIFSRTGGKPIIRLGGTSSDYGKYIPSQTEPALPVAEQDNYQDVGGTTIGPSYWTKAAHFPEAKYMVQVPLATRNISEPIAWVKAAIKGIGLENIHSIQIGNEPNLYKDDYTGEDGQPLGPPKYQGYLSNETWVGNYTQYADAILDEVDLPDAFFTAFDVAAEVNNPYDASFKYDVETCFDLGINDNNILKDVSHHYYQNQAGTAADLEAGLMDMAETHRRIDFHKPRIEYLRRNHPDIPFIFNEVGNSLSVTNSYEYQNRLGSALWQVDFYLYAMSLGTARINYQQIMHAGYDLWLPVASAGYDAQVFANYYSQPFVADFIGDSGVTTMAKVPVVNGDENISAYVAFEYGLAKRIAIVNTNYWDGSSSSERPSKSLSVTSLLGNLGLAKVRRLTSPQGATADASTITYGGSQWTYKSKGREVKDALSEDIFECKIADDGTMTPFTVRSSEAILIDLF